jgi:hypothetical protein
VDELARFRNPILVLTGGDMLRPDLEDLARAAIGGCRWPSPAPPGGSRKRLAGCARQA